MVKNKIVLHKIESGIFVYLHLFLSKEEQKENYCIKLRLFFQCDKIKVM